jgi:hypothetical protein
MSQSGAIGRRRRQFRRHAERTTLVWTGEPKGRILCAVPKARGSEACHAQRRRKLHRQFSRRQA